MFYNQPAEAATFGIYNGVQDTKGGRVTFETFCKMRAEGFAGPAAKKALPAITVGGVFIGRKLSGLVQPSGIVQIDIDAKDNPGTNWEAARADVAQLLRQMGAEGLVSISASGCGVYALAYCPELMDTYNQYGADAYLRGHRAMSAAIVEDVHNWLCYNCDRAMINRPNGLRFVSADRDAVLLASVNEFSISAA